MKSPIVKSIAKPISSPKRLILATLGLGLVFVPELLWHKLTIFLHLFYEGISFVLEHLLTHGFGISKYFAQMAVFYFIWFVALSLLYVLWRKLPKLKAKFMENLQSLAMQIKSRTSETWHQLSILQKIKFVLFQFASLAGGFVFLLA